MIDLTEKKSLYRQIFLDQPLSVKATVTTWVSVFAFSAALLIGWGWRPHMEVKQGTVFHCDATIHQNPSQSPGSPGLWKYLAWVHDETPACKEKVGNWKRRGFRVPERFLAYPALAKGQPVVVAFGFEMNRGRVRLVGVRSPEGQAIVNVDDLNEGVDLFNRSTLVTIGAYLVLGVVTGLASLRYRWRARREAVQSEQTE